MIDVGEKAPHFTLPRDGGDDCTVPTGSAPFVLFFYPRDNTPGCTKEAIAFTELSAAFAGAGIQIFGISIDNVASHDKFVAKHALNMPLLSDEKSDVCEQFGVWKEKSMYGKTFMGIERSTFLVAADGTLAAVWRKVKVPGHADAVLEAAQAL